MKKNIFEKKSKFKCDRILNYLVPRCKYQVLCRIPTPLIIMGVGRAGSVKIKFP